MKRTSTATLVACIVITAACSGHHDPTGEERRIAAERIQFDRDEANWQARQDAEKARHRRENDILRGRG